MADVSIVIAAWNVETRIARAVRSALAQEGVAVEVVVVDDCSTDDTLAALASIADPRLRVVRLAANGGPAAARNAGIVAASAPWIAVLDADDALEPLRLSRCLARAQNLNADIVVDNLTVQREADGARYPMFARRDFGRGETLDLARFIAGNAAFLGGKSLGYLKPVFSAAFLRRHHLAYDTTLRIGEDYALLAEALACGAVCAVEDSAGYAYTIRAGSISHRLSLADIDRIAAADRRLWRRTPLPPVAAQAQRKRERQLAAAASYTRLIDALKTGDAAAAWRAALTHPAALFPLWRPLWAAIQRLTRRRS